MVRRYSQTEKKALGLVWACKRFHAYLYGKRFELITVHKPLEIYTRRIHRHLQEYRDGCYGCNHMISRLSIGLDSENIADALSRLSVTTVKSTDDVKDYIRFVAKNAVLNGITIQEEEKESANDPELSMVRMCILTNSQWESVDVSYRSFRQELSVLGKLVIHDMGLVIPKSLQKKILCLAHEGHQGIVKTKQRL